MEGNGAVLVEWRRQDVTKIIILVKGQTAKDGRIPMIGRFFLE